MWNVIRSEFYKTRCRSYFYICLGVCCALALGVVLLFFWNTGGEGRMQYEVVNRLLLSALSFGVYFALLPCDIVFSEEYKYQTMKNAISSGVSRTSFYFGKLIASLVVFLFSVALISGVFMGSAYLILGVGDAVEAAEITKRVLFSFAGALPLWIGAVCVLNMMSFQFKNNMMLSFAFVGMFALLSIVVQLLGFFVSPVFNTAYSWMIMPQFDMMKAAQAVTGQMIGKCYLIGFGYAAISSAVGLLLFRRREIK